MNRVLLTGATGFVGRHCLPALLSRGFEVHAVSSQSEPLADAPASVHWHRADLLSPAEVSDLTARVEATHLLHLAWYAVPGKFWTSTENVRWVQASLELLRAFRRAGGSRLVMAGSCAEYDWSYGYCAENLTPLAPRTLYGVSKNALRMVMESFSREEGMSAAWGRIFFLYGAHEPEEKLVASVIRSLLQGTPARCSHGKQIRDFLYVEDVAAALVALLDTDVAGAVNIASGQPVALSFIIQAIASRLGRPDLIQLGAVEASAYEPPLLVGSNARLANEVGFQPRYNLQSGIDAAIDWWRGQGS
jgi:nucleoside-diphosphate-sugar epimerase